MEESIKATDLRTRTREIIERARFKSTRFIVHTFGKPAVVIMGIDEYRSLIKSAQVLENPDMPINREIPVPPAVLAVLDLAR